MKTKKCLRGEKGYTTGGLDKQWGDLVKLNAKGRCEYCGKEAHLNAHHFYSRSNHNIRWEIENGFALCPYHHTLGNWSAHKNPAEFVEWAVEKRGKEWYERLRDKKNIMVKCDVLFRKKKREELKEILKNLTPVE